MNLGFLGLGLGSWQPSLAAKQAALAAALQLLHASEPQEQQPLFELLRRVELLCGETEVAVALGDADWDAVLAAMLAPSWRRNADVVAAALTEMLTSHGPLLAAATRRLQWDTLLQLAVDAIASTTHQTRQDAVKEWSPVASGQPPAPPLSPALQLALMAMHHIPTEQQQEAAGSVLSALANLVRTAGVTVTPL